MNPWTALVNALESLISGTSGALGLSLGAGIFVVTFVVRALLIPITYPLALKTRARKQVLDRIAPELKETKQRHKGDLDRSIKEVEALHQRHGITVVDKAGVVGALIQLPILIAFFQAVLHLAEGTALAGGGLGLGVIAGALSAAGTALGGQTSSRVVVTLTGLLPVGICLWLGAGIASYLTAFYAATLIQSVMMRRDPGVSSARSGAAS